MDAHSIRKWGFSLRTHCDGPDLIISGQVSEALELTSKALMSGISEMQLLYILKNHFSRLCISYNSHDIKEVMAKCRIPFFAAKVVKEQSRRIRSAAVFSGLEDIFRAEYSLKSARFRPDLVIELLIMRLFLAIEGNK